MLLMDLRERLQEAVTSDDIQEAGRKKAVIIWIDY